jgi:hypothetical protein
MLAPRALGVITAVVCGQVLIGLLAAAALLAARRRASKRAVVQIALIIGFVESFIIAIGLAAWNTAARGSETLTAALLWYAGAGWGVVQLVIVVWITWVWWQRRKGRSAGD